jgi:hypothetical protein
MVQVSRLGSKFTVLVNGVSHGSYETRGEAIKAAIEYKENN